jgi:DNA repair protein SbcD/Mre11
MIRVLHLADLHIGVENYGRVDPETGLHTRLLDYLARLDEAIEVGLREGVHAVLIAGDIYKNRTPNPTHQREFAKRIRRIREAGLPVFILIGNHDVSPTAGRANSIEIFHTLALDGVTVASRPGLHQIETAAGPLQIVALPWVTRHNLLTKDDLRLASIREVEALLLERVDRFLQAVPHDLDPALPTILTVHGTIHGATTGAEQQMMLDRDLVLPRSVVMINGVDYVALGHIHKHQSLGNHPPIVYPGSIERVDFGEEHEAKGCVIVDLEKGATTWRFVKLAARPFITVDVDARNAPDPQARALMAIEKQDLREAVVRVRVQARAEQADLLRTDDLREAAEQAGAAVVAAVAIDLERAGRSRLAPDGQDPLEGLTPRHALELFLRSKSPPLSEARISALLEAADELLSERNAL